MKITKEELIHISGYIIQDVIKQTCFYMTKDSFILGRYNGNRYKLCEINTGCCGSTAWYPLMGENALSECGYGDGVNESFSLVKELPYLKNNPLPSDIEWFNKHGYNYHRTTMEFTEFHIFDTLEEFIDFVNEGGLK